MRVVVMVLMLLVPPLLSASELERSEMAKFAKEIDFLIAHVDEIKRHAEPDARMKFQYNDLKDDLQKIRDGISQYIEADINNGRDMQPIKAIYK